MVCHKVQSLASELVSNVLGEQFMTNEARELPCTGNVVDVLKDAEVKGGEHFTTHVREDVTVKLGA